MAPVPSGEPSSTTSTRKPSGAASAEHATGGGDDGLEVLGLVEGGQDEPGGSGHEGPRTLWATPMPDPPNATIASLFDELADLYELDGAVVHRVLAYRNAAKSVREAPRSVAAMTREGKVTELPGIGAHARGEDRGAARDGHDPGRREAARRIPAGLIDLTRLPGLGPKRARKLYDELGIDSLESLRAAAEAQKLRDVRGFGAKFEEAVLEAFAAGVGEAPEPRVLLNKALEIGEGIVEALRAHPGLRSRRAGRLGAAPGRLGQGPRHHRHGLRPAGAAGRLRRARRHRERGFAGRERRAGAHPHRRLRRPARGRARPVRQPPAALHRLQGAQPGAARGGGAPRAARLRVRPARRRHRRDAPLRDRGGGLRAARACRGSRPSCARTAASWR